MKFEAPFEQAVLWPGVTGAAEDPEGLVAYLEEQFPTCRFKFIGQYLTLPNRIDGVDVPGSGGRSDVVFAIHQDDIGKFAVPRFEYGMRWVDDVILNEKFKGEETIYCEEIHALMSWPDRIDPTPEFHEDV